MDMDVESNIVVPLPGEIIHLPKPSTKLGPGTAVNTDGVPFYCKAGTVKRRGDEAVWINCIKKRYVPSEGERVIGIVLRSGRAHRIDIGASRMASLPELAFEGATRRNRIALQVGDLVFARLTKGHIDCEPELSCVDNTGNSNGLGLLKNSGTLIKCSLSLCRHLLRKGCPVLKALEKYYKFECVVGLNGRVLVSNESIQQTIVIRNCIIASEYMDTNTIIQMVDKATLKL